MLILLDCRPLQKEGLRSEKSRFLFSLAAGLTKTKGVRWLFLLDKAPLPGELPDLPGSRSLVEGILPGRLGRKWGARGQIPRLAKKVGAEGILLTGKYPAGASSIPWFGWLFPGEDPRPAAGWSRAGAIFCLSEKERDRFSSRLAILPEKLIVSFMVPDPETTPFTPGEREEGKNRYAEGKEYFLADIRAAGQQEVLYLLKAFSLFKKRQLSNMQLVVTGRKENPERRLKDLLETYKYRQDLHWVEYREQEWARMAPAAYAVLLPFEKDSLGQRMLDSWKARIPVILSRQGFPGEIAGEAVIGISPEDPASLATALMSIYKDETLRQELIEKGAARLELFKGELSLAAVWDGIGRAYPIIS